MSGTENPANYSERKILFLVAAVVFVNIVDFMMVIPMGPDFAEGLGIPSSELGLIGASYTFAAFITGLFGSLFLDRFDRRKALIFCLIGLMCGTALGGFARDLYTLIMARMVAGAFGGPAAALGFAIVSDVVPPERRGRAMGAVMGAFSASAVLGVPAGLELARLGGWRLPFFVLAGCGLVLGVGAGLLLPPLKGHLKYFGNTSPLREIGNLLNRNEARLALLVQFGTMAAGFLIIPNLSAYIQYNAHFPREKIGMLYLMGGMITFFLMRATGWLIDKKGIAPVILIATGVLITNLVEGFAFGEPHLPVLAMFLIFMSCQSVRNVSVQTVTTKVPLPQERARFQSLQTAVQHLATSVGAFSSTFFLREIPGPRLEGIPKLAAISIGLSLLVPFGLISLDKKLKGKEH